MGFDCSLRTQPHRAFSLPRESSAVRLIISGGITALGSGVFNAGSRGDVPGHFDGVAFDCRRGDALTVVRGAFHDRRPFALAALTVVAAAEQAKLREQRLVTTLACLAALGLLAAWGFLAGCLLAARGFLARCLLAALRFLNALSFLAASRLLTGLADLLLTTFHLALAAANLVAAMAQQVQFRHLQLG